MRGSRTERPTRQVLLALLFALPLIFSDLFAVPPAAADDLAARIAAARARQAELQQAIDHQQQLVGQLREDQGVVNTALEHTGDQLDGINADQAAVRAEIAAATDALARVEARHAALVDEIAQLDWTIDLLEQEIAQGEEDLDVRRGLLAQRLAQAYQTQQTSLLEQIIAASSFTDILADVDSYLRFGDQDAELAAGIERDRDSLEQMRRLTDATRYRTDQLRLAAQAAAAGIREERRRLDAARARLDALEAETRRILEQQRAKFSEIAQDKQAAERYVAEHEAAEEQLRTDLAALIAEAQRRAEEERRRREEERRRREEAARRREQQREREQREQREREQREREQREREQQQPRQPSGNGMFIWPASGVVTQEFGCTGFAWEPAVGDCAHFHDGIDISNADGTPIQAAGSGVVIYVGYGYGGDPAFMVGVAHGGGLETWYTHLQPRYAPGIRQGVSVRRGQVIGYMGNTGRSTGTHLHWEVLRGGRAINPRLYT